MPAAQQLGGLISQINNSIQERAPLSSSPGSDNICLIGEDTGRTRWIQPSGACPPMHAVHGMHHARTMHDMQNGAWWHGLSSCTVQGMLHGLCTPASCLSLFQMTQCSHATVPTDSAGMPCRPQEARRGH